MLTPRLVCRRPSEGRAVARVVRRSIVSLHKVEATGEIEESIALLGEEKNEGEKVLIVSCRPDYL